jgi:hypothetical protein
MSMRIREVNSKDDMAKVIDDYITTGYRVKESGSNSALMQKKTWGGVLGIVAVIVGLLFSIFTIGISLLLLVYPIYAHYAADKVLVRIGEAPEQKAGTL